jgi:hypothetical protein
MVVRQGRRTALIVLAVAVLLAGALAIAQLSLGGGDSGSGVMQPTPTVALADSRLTSGSLSTPVPGELGAVLIDLAGARWLAWLRDQPYGASRAAVLAVSPDGNELILSDGRHLFVASLDGKSARELASASEESPAFWAGFSADGRSLAILSLPSGRLTLRPWPDGNGLEMNLSVQSARWVSNSLAVRTPDGALFVSPEGHVAPIRCDADFGTLPPLYEPVTRREAVLAFWTNINPCSGAVPQALYVVEPGGEPLFVTELGGADEVRVGGVSLSPDGSLLAVTVAPVLNSPDHPFLFDNMEIRVIEVASGKTQLTIPKSGFRVLSWSPVENVLLFDRDSCRPPKWQLTLVDGDGSNMRPLADPSLEIQPMFHAWSPDGSRLAAVTNTDVVSIDVTTGTTQSVPLSVNPPLFGVSWLAPGLLSVFAGGGTDFCP